MLQLLLTIKSYLRILRFSSWKCRKLIPLADNDTTLKILGNGKSLVEIDLSTKDKVEYMVVNRHVLADNYVEIKPQYYVLADPFFFTHPDGKNILKEIDEKTSWDMTLFVPYNRKAQYAGWFRNTKISVKSYNATSFNGFTRIAYKLYDKKLAMPAVQNVLVACIMLGIYMKFRRVELYGVEHNWLKNLYVGDDNLVYLLNEHFYDKEKVLPRPQKEIQNLDEYPLYLNILHYSKMFQSYWEISQYVKETGITTKIINCTKGSYIDAFERGKI